MEFPPLFDPSPEPEVAKPRKPSGREDAQEKPGTTLATVSGPLSPVKEIIRDVEVLKNALDRRSHPTFSMIGEDLLALGYITPEQLDRALRIQVKHGGKQRMGEILVSTGAVTRDQIDFVLARRLGVPAVDLRHFKVSPAAVRMVPKVLASKFTLMPCMIHRNQIVVAMENPMDQNALKALRFACERHILTVMATKADIEWAIPQYYKDVRNYKGPADHWK